MHNEPYMTQPTKPKKTFLQVVWDILFTIFYPILIIFSLLFVGVVYLFSAISWLVSRLLPRREVEESTQPVVSVWEQWVTLATVSIERILEEEIMFGPSYYQLRTFPASETIVHHYFGDFHHECFGGVLLQKWNTVIPKELPDFDLLFFNGETQQLHYLDTIKAFVWQVEETDKKVVLRWQENEEKGTLTLTEDQVLHDARLLD